MASESDANQKLEKGTYTFRPIPGDPDRYYATSPEQVSKKITNAEALRIDRIKPDEQFESGAVRDTQKGKGFYYLLPYGGIQRLADVFERGAERYGPRNWEKGIPVERYMDSALRHTFKYLDGHTDEDHLGHAAWNLVCAIATEDWCERGKLPKSLLLESRARYVNHPEEG